jgi:predicted nucleic acid-binding protein
VESAKLNALLDSDILLDFLDGHPPAAEEIARYRECRISVISWMEVLAGARTQAD